MNKVYIPQEPMRFDKATESMVPSVNLEPAADYGDITICLPPGQVALSTQPTVDRLKECLKDFSDNDYLVAVGDPSLIAICSAIVAETNRGKFKLLKWIRDRKQYVQVQVDIYHRLNKGD